MSRATQLIICGFIAGQVVAAQKSYRLHSQYQNAPVVTLPAEVPKRIFILSGQSNMNGRGPVEELTPEWRNGDEHKGPIYPAIRDAIEQARQIPNAVFEGVLWKQGGADARTKETVLEYMGNHCCPVKSD